MGQPINQGTCQAFVSLVGVGSDIVGDEFNNFGLYATGLFVLAKVAIGNSPPAVGICIIGIELDGLGEFRNGFVVLAGFAVGISSGVVIHIAPLPFLRPLGRAYSW